MAFRILIVDDDLHTRRILETLLSREPGLDGPEITSAADGQEALEALDRVTPDLVITDVRMPRMDGYAFSRALRRHANGEKVPLLLVSAVLADRPQLAELEREVGAEFFAKPYQLRELVRAVLRLLVEPTRPRRQKASTPIERLEVVEAQAGSLLERPVPRLLFELFDAQATGVLAVSRAQMRKQIFILLGHPIGADSNLRSETLAQLLAARGVVPPAQLEEAIAAAGRGRDRLGAILIERGLMKESDVMHYLATQVRLKIVNALRWEGGEYHFQPGDTFSGRMTHLTVDTPRVVLSALRQTAHPDTVAQAALLTTGRLALAPRFKRHREAFTRVFGDTYLPLLHDAPRPRDLALRGDANLLRAYDALLLTGLGALLADDADAEEAGATPAGPPEVEVRREEVYDELFGDRDVVPPPPTLLTRPDDSGVFPLPLPPPTGPSDPESSAAREELLRAWVRLGERNHYDVLGVPRDADATTIVRAHERRRDELSPDRFAGHDLGRDHPRLDEILAALDEARATLLEGERRAAYDLTLPPPSPRLIDARMYARGEAAFRDGLRLLHGGKPVEAVQRLEEAASAGPEQADYHAMLGWARFLARDASADLAAAAKSARAALDAAFAADPDHAGAHEFAGRVAFVLGDDAAAADHLERALRADPTRSEALQTLEALCLRTAQHARLASQLRSLIDRLGESRAAPMWHDLAMLLRDHLGDKAGARETLSTYLRLVPGDAAALRALEGLADRNPLTAPKDEKKTAEALRAAWHAAPGNVEPLRQLFHLHIAGARPETALQAAAALVARGAADDEAGAFIKRHRPRYLQRAVTQLAWAQVDAIRHPDDDRDLASLFTRVFAAAPPEPTGGRPEGPRRSVEDLEPVFGQVLSYVAWLLGVAPPTIVCAPAWSGPPRIVHPPDAPPLLVAAPATLATNDKLALSFIVGRALSALYPARAQAVSLSAQRLKSYLAASTALLGAEPELSDEEAVRVRERLASFPNLRDDLRPILERLSARSDRINVSRWLRGIAHTAERVGLVVSGDLIGATGILEGEATPSTDLCDFALSDEFRAVRESIGLVHAM